MDAAAVAVQQLFSICVRISSCSSNFLTRVVGRTVDKNYPRRKDFFVLASPPPHVYRNFIAATTRRRRRSFPIKNHYCSGKVKRRAPRACFSISREQLGKSRYVQIITDVREKRVGVDFKGRRPLYYFTLSRKLYIKKRVKKWTGKTESMYIYTVYTYTHKDLNSTLSLKSGFLIEIK